MADSPWTRPSLLVRLRDERDHEARARFVEVYGPLIYGFARRQGLQDADAADLIQDSLRVVAGAVKGLEYDPARGSFRAWLFTVVRNQLLRFRSRQNRAGRGSDDGLGGDPAWNFQSRVSADGRAVVAWHEGISGQQYALVRRTHPRSTLAKSPDGHTFNEHWVMPNADASLVFRFGPGIYDGEMRIIAADAFKGQVLLPTVDPAREQRPRGGAPPRPAGGAEANRPGPPGRLLSPRAARGGGGSVHLPDRGALRGRQPALHGRGGPEGHDRLGDGRRPPGHATAVRAPAAATTASTPTSASGWS